MLQSVGPQPMIEPEKLRTEADWIQAGRTVFEQMDHLHLRTFDPAFIEIVRRGELLALLKDGTASNVRWVPTKDGVALAFPNCAACHTLVTAEGSEIPGAPAFAGTGRRTGPPGPAIIVRAQQAQRFVTGGAPIRMGPEPVGSWLFSAYGVPWIKDDEHERLKSMSEAQYQRLVAAGVRGGAVPRWNGSLYYPAKVPDLIGIKERKYIDHTATHLNRGIGDLMRYAALVSTAESTKFGPHNVLPPTAEVPKVRRSDEALYAISLYLQSINPPPNPNRVSEDSTAGQKIFHREGCSGCHAPPLYTNNKLTVAQGFQLPKERPSTLDVLPVSVGTDPGLAMQTRKGTGYYKVPSLKGVWYRGHYLHDGSVASLEEMFNPERLNDTHVPGGYSPPGVKNRAIKGHEFGLKLNARERAQLIAFLRTL
jgi:mono/diheme cytochrome c family protein